MVNNFVARYHLCDLFGIPLYLDFSLIILLLMFALGGGPIHIGLLCAVVLLVSITAHELGHALTARAFGYETRDITLSLLGGCASLISLPRKAWQEFLTAIAGPLVSFIFSGIGSVGYWFIPFDGLLVALFYYLMVINMMLGVFNLLPGFPMDGGRIFRSAMRPFMSRVKATYTAMIVGRVVAVGLGIMGLYRIFNGGNWGFVTLLIAWMIWKDGYREYIMTKMESAWDYNNFRAKVSPPPYGGDGDDCDITRA